MAVDIGAIIRELRKASGMTQTRLADKIGVSYQQVQKYEKGLSKVTVQRLMSIADALGVHVSVFLEGAGEKALDNATVAGIANDELVLLKLYRQLATKRIKRSVLDMVEALGKASGNG